MTTRISANELFEQLRERLGLRWLAGQTGETRVLEAVDTVARRPSLAGYLNTIYPNKVQILGSEELSSLAAPIQQRIPATYVALNVGDAARLGVNHAELVSITLDGHTFSLPARVRPDLPAGVLGLPVGLAGVPPYKAGSAATVAKGA